MPIDDAAVPGRNGNIGEQTADEAGPNCNPAHRTDDRLAAVDHIVDDVARLLPLPCARREVVDILLDDREIAAGREYLPSAGQDHRIDARVGVNITPDVAEFRMQCGIRRVHPAVLHRNAENLGVRAIKFEPRIARIRIGHRRLASYRHHRA
jgi:hypothetical protein